MLLQLVFQRKPMGRDSIISQILGNIKKIKILNEKPFNSVQPNKYLPWKIMSANRKQTVGKC